MRQEKRIGFRLIFPLIIRVEEFLKAYFFRIPIAHQAMRNLGLGHPGMDCEGLNQ